MFIFVGEKNDEVVKKIRWMNYHLGAHNLSNNLIVQHTKSQDNDKFLDLVITEYTTQYSGLGFSMMRKISFAHTIYNINQNVPVLTPRKNKKLPPVFVIGNGPSLDNLIDVIQENREHAIIITCGSALTTLYALGIKPDLHVEQERVYGVAQMLSLGTDKTFTQDIPLLMLNNVAPAVRELFSDAYMAIKPNDLGASILHTLLPKHDFFELMYCNPTVTNCGLAFALALGFDEVYLMGTDYGMPDSQTHHSKHSLWNKLQASDDDKTMKIVNDYSYNNDQFSIKGNFAESVVTNPLLNNSRIFIEHLLKMTAVSCYNPNNGAYINGTKTINKDEMVFDQTIDNKSALVQSLLDHSFKSFDFSKIGDKEIQRDYIAILVQAKEALLLREYCENMLDLIQQLDLIFHNIKKIEEVCKPAALLLRGSFNVHAGMLIYYAARADTLEAFSRCYAIGQRIYNQFIDDALTNLADEPLALDDTAY